MKIGGASIFANGIPLTFEKGITVAADVYGGFNGTSALKDKQNISITINGTAMKDVYGGSGIYEKLTSLGSSSINITFGEDSLVYGNIYGGGKNSNTGSAEHPIPVNIILNGSAANDSSSQYNTKTHMICGGSYIMPSVALPMKQYGDVNITVKEKAFLANKNQNSVNIIGGGRSSGTRAHHFTLFGNINIDIMSADRDEAITYVSGGGYAETSSNPGSSLVVGNIKIASHRSVSGINGGGRTEDYPYYSGVTDIGVSGDITMTLYSGTYEYVIGGGTLPLTASGVTQNLNANLHADVSGHVSLNIHEAATVEYAAAGGYVCLNSDNCTAKVGSSSINIIESADTAKSYAKGCYVYGGRAKHRYIKLFAQNITTVAGDSTITIDGDKGSETPYFNTICGDGDGGNSVLGVRTMVFNKCGNDFCGNLDAFDKIIITGSSEFTLSADKTTGGASTDLSVENSKLTLGSAYFSNISVMSKESILKITKDTTVTGELNLSGALEIEDGATLTAGSLTAYGSITFKGTGKIAVTGSMSGDVAIYIPAGSEMGKHITYGSGSPIIKPAVETKELKLTNTKLSLKPNEERDLVAVVLPENATLQKITWGTTDAAIVSVDQKGHVTALTEGSASINVKIEGTELSADCKIEVKIPVISVRSVEVSPKPLTLTEGDTAQLAARITPQDATNPNISYKSNNSEIVSTYANGRIEAIKAGEAVVTVTAGDKSDSVTIMVTPKPALVIPVSSIELTHAAITTAKNKKASVTALVTENATNRTLTWSCDKSVEITAITETGCEITARKAGEYTLTASANDGSKTEASCTVKVIDESLQIAAPIDTAKTDKQTAAPKTVPATEVTKIIETLIAAGKLEGSDGEGFVISESKAKEAAEQNGVKPETIVPLQTVAGIIDSEKKTRAILAFAIAGGNIPEDAKTFADIAILKLTASGDFVPLTQASGEEGLVQGAYMIKSGDTSILPTDTPDRGAVYTLCVAVDDNGSFDYDSAEGSVVDTPALGVKNATTPIPETNPVKSTGGCNSGIGITALTAAAALRWLLRRKQA